jgi:hypothetical protein
MTLPRTAAEVLSGHVMLEVRCIDRVMLTFRQPRLQYGQGIHNFFCQHRGNRFASSALMLPMTERFTADIRHYIDARGCTWSGSPRGRARTRSPGSTWPGITAGSASCSSAWPRRRPGCGGPRSAGTRRRR